MIFSITYWPWIWDPTEIVCLSVLFPCIHVPTVVAWFKPPEQSIWDGFGLPFYLCINTRNYKIVVMSELTPLEEYNWISGKKNHSSPGRWGLPGPNWAWGSIFRLPLWCSCRSADGLVCDGFWLEDQSGCQQSLVPHAWALVTLPLTCWTNHQDIPSFHISVRLFAPLRDGRDHSTHLAWLLGSHSGGIWKAPRTGPGSRKALFKG